MSMKYNSAEITSINFGSTKIDKVIYNGVTVFTSEPTNYSKVKNATSTSSAVSESDWLAFLEDGGVPYIINKGETAEFLNKYINIPNGVTPSSYNYWQIADFNHDGTKNTVDLIQVNNVSSQRFSTTANATYQKYENSDIRTWLTGTYYNGFSTNIKNALKTMAVVTAKSNIVNDKVKILSVTEGGFTQSDSGTPPTNEGNKYPISITFKSGVDTNKRNLTRSAATGNTTQIFYLYENTGKVARLNVTYISGIVPVIRF